MTMENGGGDILDAAQAALENINTPQGPTNAQFSRLETQVGELLQATRSAQGLTSKGLDAIRRDLGEQLATVKGEVDQFTKAASRQWLLDLPEEQQVMATRLLAEFDKGAAARQPAQLPPPQEFVQPEPEQDAAAGWEAIHSSVRMFGLDPRDPNIDYSMWTDTTIDDSTRNTRFASSLRAAIIKSGNVQQPPVAQQPAQRQAPANPPVQGPPGGGANQSFEALRDSFLTGNMLPEAYRAQAAALGVRV